MLRVFAAGSLEYMDPEVGPDPKLDFVVVSQLGSLGIYMYI